MKINLDLDEKMLKDIEDYCKYFSSTRAEFIRWALRDKLYFHTGVKEITQLEHIKETRKYKGNSDGNAKIK